jgi:hypothetical protein
VKQRETKGGEKNINSKKGEYKKKEPRNNSRLKLPHGSQTRVG